jgi:RNA polymerase sigma-70 factor, ECF subfamily
MLSELELMARARRFDATALGELYDTHSPAVYRYAMRLLDDAPLAEDCVTETFSRLLTALKTDKGPDRHLKAWLFRVAHNWCADQYRAGHGASVSLDELEEAGGFEPADAPELGPSGAFERAFAASQVRAALMALTSDQRLAMTLRFYEDMPNDEIAAALGKPIGAVKALHFRAMAALRRRLAPVTEEQR